MMMMMIEYNKGKILLLTRSRRRKASRTFADI